MTTLVIGDGRTISAATGGRDISDAEHFVLLLHGAGMDRTVWSLQTRWLAHHDLPTIAIDLPGHGASDEPERDSIEDYADWVAEIVTELGRPTTVVGHSMGSFIAIEAALRVEVASVVLVGTAASMPVHPKLLDAAAANDPLAAQLMSGWAFAPAVKTGPHPSPGSSMVGSTQAMIGQSAPGVLSNDLAMCAAYDRAVESAAQITAPVTLVLGQLDRMTPTSNASGLIDALANPTVCTVPGVGHMIQIEAPAETRTQIHSAASVGRD